MWPMPACSGSTRWQYAVLAFGGVVLSRRLRMFDLRQQTTQVGVFLR